eukprot:762457-Hanusia_phi.AAC.1
MYVVRHLPDDHLLELVRPQLSVLVEQSLRVRQVVELVLRQLDRGTELQFLQATLSSSSSFSSSSSSSS